MNRRVGLLVILAFFSLGALEARAQDAAEERARRASAVEFRWDNVERRPEWVSGIAPRRPLGSELHFVELEPGQKTCVRIPGNEWLRVYGVDGPLGSGVKVGLSMGSGLVAYVEPVKDKTGRSLLADPESSHDMLGYVIRPKDSIGSIRVALFVSRHVRARDRVEYRDPVDLGRNGLVRLSYSDSADRERFWKLGGGENRKVTVRGPGRFLVESRYIYPGNETGLSQSFQIYVKELGTGSPLATLEYATGPDSARVVHAGGGARLMSKLESAYFELEDDRPYQLEITSSATVLTRITRGGEGGYLFAGVNAPGGVDESPTGACQRSLWQLDEAEIREVLNDPNSFDVGTIERVAMRLARENFRPEGGLTASNLLRGAGFSRRFFPEVLERWEDLSGRFSYFSDLLPRCKGLGEFNTFYFPVRRLQPIGSYRHWTVLGNQQGNSAFEQLPSATFCKLKGENEKLHYRVPARSVPTLVRIAADGGGLAEPGTFYLGVGGMPPKRFEIQPQAEIPWLETRVSRGEAGLQMIGGGTLGSMAARLRTPAPLVRAGVFEFYLPSDVEDFEIWGRDGLPVAVQVQASASCQLSCDEYLSLVDSVADGDAIAGWLRECLTGDGGCGPECPRAKRELFNQWEPLRRFVQSRYRVFTSSVPMVELDSNRDWIAQLDGLIEADEHYLATLLCRSLYLHATEEEVRSQALAKLDELALLELDRSTLIINACANLVQKTNTDAIMRLAELLRDEGEGKLALSLSLALPGGQRDTRELRLATAFSQGWWAVFDSIIDEAPDDTVCLVWKGIRYSSLGRESEAREQWLKAGGPGNAWLEHVGKTSRAKELLANGDQGGLRMWAEADAHHPGKRVWRPARPELIRRTTGGIRIHAIERDNHFNGYLADVGQPLELRLDAPGLLRVECRPLHPGNSTSPIEGWISIDRSDAPGRKLPVINNFRTSGLGIEGGEEGLGYGVSDEIALGGWNCRLTIEPDFGPIVVRVFENVPEVRAGCLPPITLQTAAWHFGGRGSREEPPDTNSKSEFGAVKVIDGNQQVRQLPVLQPFTDLDRLELVQMRSRFEQLPIIDFPRMPNQTRDALATLSRYLWHWEHDDPNCSPELLAAASAIAHAHGKSPEISQVFSKFTRRTFWEPVLTAESSAGFREIEFDGWSPESPFLRSRMDLLPELDPNEQLVSADDEVIAMLTNREENTISVTLAAVRPPFIEQLPVRATLQIGDGDPVEFELSSENPVEEVVFGAEAGRTMVRVSSQDLPPNHYLKFGIGAENENSLYERTTKREYFVSRVDEHLIVRVAGPSWVRVGRLQDKKQNFEYYHVRNDLETLTLPPIEGEKESLYRVHILRHDPARTYRQPTFAEREVRPVAEPYIAGISNTSLGARPVSATYDDRFDLGGQEDGTWTAGLGFHDRRPLDEDDTEKVGSERFFQADLTYRFFDPAHRLWHRASVLGRVRDKGEQTMGAEYSLQFRPNGSPINYTFTGTAYSQGGEWSLKAVGSIGASQNLGSKLSHSPVASVFLRELSLDEYAGNPGSIDQDIFTSFKSDHRYGLRIGDKLHYRPWRDTRLSLGLGLMTNEDFNPFDPDHYRYSLGVDELLGPVQISAEFRGLRFLEDGDRRESEWSHQTNLGLMGEYWLPNQNRVEIGVNWTHFIEQSENSVFLVGRWHFGKGRGLRDFRPAERSFVGERERRAMNESNDHLK